MMKRGIKTLLITIGLLFSMVPVYAGQTVEVEIPIEVNTPSTIVITAVDGGPLPSPSEKRIEGSGSFTLSLNTLNTYQYEVKIKLPGEDPKVTYDETVWVVQAGLFLEADNTLNPIVALSKKGEEEKYTKIVFENEREEDPPVKKYRVRYRYEGEYPKEVMDTLPVDPNEYDDGTTINPKTPPTEVKVSGGKWVFKGWDEDPCIVCIINGADIEYVGRWEFVADEVPPEDPDNPPEKPTDTSVKGYMPMYIGVLGGSAAIYFVLSRRRKEEE